MLPVLKVRLETIIQSKEEIKKIFERINSENWLFQSRVNRETALGKIIGNGFCVGDLDEDQKELLFHFDQYGFKILWHLLKYVDENWIETYDEAINHVKIDICEKKREIDDFVLYSELSGIMENTLKLFYEGNLEGVDDRIYSLCLGEIKKIVDENKCYLSFNTIVNALYGMCHKNEQRGRFFWETFDWEELESIITKEGGDSCAK